MLCGAPYISGEFVFPCGRCVSCRKSRAGVWAHRIMLESLEHGDNVFLTLTYSEESLRKQYGPIEHADPQMECLPSVRKRDFSLFLKRLRKAIEPKRIRFYGVGEYGEKTERPHYHVVLFGLPGCEKGVTSVDRRGHCCAQCDFYGKLWSFGNIFCGEVSIRSARYVAGYVTKAGWISEEELNGREPQFCRMSLKPGIGAYFMDEVASTCLDYDPGVDVPTHLRHGGRLHPLGRYLRRRLRERIGRDTKAPMEAVEAQRERLRPLREIAKSYAKAGQVELAFRNEVLNHFEGMRRKKERKGRAGII